LGNMLSMLGISSRQWMHPRVAVSMWGSSVMTASLEVKITEAQEDPSMTRTWVAMVPRCRFRADRTRTPAIRYG